MRRPRALPGPPRRWAHLGFIGALGAASVLLVSACGVFGGDELEPLTITSDRGDDYVWQEDDGAIVVTPEEGNENRNLRQVLARSGWTSEDQEACATWDGPIDQAAQPGIALRIREDDGRVRAITVSNNVWSAARFQWNVHLADSSSDRPMTPGGRGQLPHFASSLADLTPPPWRMCARVEGKQLTAKIWGPADEDGEPAWDDPDSTFRIEVPSAWVYEGEAGIYQGHLEPDERATFTDIETTER